MTYGEENIIFCKSCLYSVDIFKIDTVQNHIKLKTHLTKVSKKSSQLEQKTIITLLKCEEVRDDFVLDFLKMCTLRFPYTKLTK